MIVKRNKNKKRNALKKGIFILPNLFTSANVFSGCFSIFCSIDGRFDLAAIAIFIAVFLDGLDGRIARAANAVSDFGKQYDSLSDLISFGVAPAILYYSWCSNNPYDVSQERILFLISFFYIVCTALRLARFNNLVQLKDDNHFIGLPSPASATLCAVVIWQCHLNFIDPLISYVIISSTLSLSAALMVSSVKYNNFKDLKTSNRMPFVGTLFVPLLMILILLNPPMILTIISVIFLISGPLSYLLSFFTKRELSEEES
jgi:CDP-diacylglycerol--serine O-phosphatidyltransferase